MKKKKLVKDKIKPKPKKSLLQVMIENNPNFGYFDRYKE